MEECLLWQTIVFVESIVMHVNSKQSKIAWAVKPLKEKYFGENVIYTSAILIRSKNIAESAQSSRVIC